MIVALRILYPLSSIELLISERLVSDDESNRRMHAIGWWIACEACAIDGSERGDAAFNPGSGWLLEGWTFACSIG
jgi:hypothetical protein